MAIRPDDYDQPMTLEDRIDTAKAQMFRDVLAGDLSTTIRSFSEAHDYRDANYYGNLFNEGTFGEAGPAFDQSEVEDIVNPLQDALDAWIKAGGLNGGVPPDHRSYLIGLPVVVTVYDDGRGEYSVDLSEAYDAPLDEESVTDVSDDIAVVDSQRISADITRNGANLEVTR